MNWTNVLVYADQPSGQPRFTYARLEGAKVAALVNFTPSDPFEPGIPCFGIGYAVHKDFRGQGRAQSLVNAAIAELKNGLARNGFPIFYIEAIVGADNEVSQRVAAATIAPDAKPGTDQYSGDPIFQYVKKIEVR